MQVARQKLGKKNTHPLWRPPLPYGSHRRPMAAMVPHPRRHRTQQSANMMHDKSMLLKLEDIIVFTIY
jgi:hypothetical protein